MKPFGQREGGRTRGHTWGPRARPGWVLPLVAISVAVWTFPVGGVAEPVQQAEEAADARPADVRGTDFVGTEAAIRALEQVVAADPARLDARLELGALLLETGRVAAALTELEAAVRIDADSPRARHLLALALHRDGQLRRSLEEYQNAIALTPSDEDLYLELADLLLTGNLEDQAMAILERTVQMFPDSRWARVSLAEVRFDAGRVEDALEDFRIASALDGAPDLDPDYDRERQAFILRRIGEMEAHLLRFDEALVAYRKVLDLDPENLDAHLGLGRLYLRRNRLEEALDEYEEGVRRDPGSLAARRGLAETYLRMERFTESVTAAEQVLEIDSADLSGHYLLATALVRAGRLDDGRKALEEYRRLEEEARAAEHRATDIDTFYRGAVARLLEGEPEEAIRLFREGLAAYPDARQLYLNLALTLSRLERPAEAAETYEEMIRAGLGDDPGVHRNLADAYARIGDEEASRRHRAIYLQMESGVEHRSGEENRP